MQTLNILESQRNPFSVLTMLNNDSFDQFKHETSLVEQLQTTLDLDKILNIFAMEAARHVSFSGLYFKNESINKALRGSKKSEITRAFKLKINNKTIGVLTYALNAKASVSALKNLDNLHQQLVYPLRNAIQYYQAMQMAMQDVLTGLSNRRQFDQQLKRAMRYAQRHHKQVGLILGDLNKFKYVNDTYGHLIGDQILKEFSKILLESIRESDSAFRFGGDEFAIIVEGDEKDALEVIKSRINKALESNKLLSKYAVGCSLGYTFMTDSDNEHTFFIRADKAMYQEKMISKKSFKNIKQS